MATTLISIGHRDLGMFMQDIDMNIKDLGLMNGNRQRATNTLLKLDSLTRTQARDEIIELLFSGDLTQGDALKILRVQVLGVKQAQFAKMVKVSRKTLSDIENNKGNYSVQTLNQIFRPFGLKVGLVRL
jgi:DNA-binding XRE family transcriptional regulator